MTNKSLEEDLRTLQDAIIKIEEAGMDKCSFIHTCRRILVSMLSYQAQVKRGISLINEGKVEEALTELGS